MAEETYLVRHFSSTRNSAQLGALSDVYWPVRPKSPADAPTKEQTAPTDMAPTLQLGKEGALLPGSLPPLRRVAICESSCAHSREIKQPHPPSPPSVPPLRIFPFPPFCNSVFPTVLFRAGRGALFPFFRFSPRLGRGGGGVINDHTRRKKLDGSPESGPRDIEAGGARATPGETYGRG